MLKKLIKFLVILSILGVVIVGILLWNINPIVESFRPKLAKLISDTINQPTDIGGISLKLFPTQSVELKNITLAGGTPGATSIARAMLDVNLAALIKKRLEVTEVAVDGLNVTVTKEADGAMKVGGLPIGKGKNDPTQPPPKDEKNDPSAISFQTKTFTLKSGKIAFEDKSVAPPQTIAISDLEVDVRNITQSSIEKFSVGASLLGAKPKNLSITGSVKGLGGVPTAIEPDVTLNFKSIDLSRIQNLMEVYGKTKIDKLSLKDTLDFELTAKGGMANPLIDIKIDGKPADLQFGELFAKAAGSAFGISTSIKPILPAQIEIPKLEFTLGSSVIKLPLSLNPLTKAVKVAIASDGIGLSDLQKFLPMLKTYTLGGSVAINLNVDVPGAAPGQMPKPNMNGAVELKDIEAALTLPPTEGKSPDPLQVKGLNGKIELQGDDVNIKGLKFSLAGQPLEIGTKVAGIPEPSIQYALRSTQFNFGPVLKSVKPGGIEALNGSSVDGLQVTGAFDKKSRAGNVALNVDKGTFASFPLAAIKIVADFALDEANKPLRATLQPSSLGIFGGNASFQGGLAPTKDINFQLKAGGIDIRKALDVVMPNSKISMSGTVESFALQITANQANVPGTLAGPLNMVAKEGVIDGVNIVGQALGKINTIPGVEAALLSFIPPKYAVLFQGDKTSFDQVTLDARLNGPTTTINSFRLMHSAYQINGQGTVEKSGNVDMKCQLTLNPILANGMVERQPKLKLLQDDNGGIEFPITITKRDGIPIVIPDISRLAKNALKNTAKEAAKGAINKGLEKVAPGLGGALDSLF